LQAKKAAIHKNKSLKPIVMVTGLLIINLVIASLMNSHVYFQLENYLYEQYNSYLIEIKNETHQVFSVIPNSQWQDKATLLADKFDTVCNIIERNNENLTDKTLATLALPRSISGFVDMEMATIYFPLNKQFVVELGPVPFNTWLTFISEWFSWITAICVNLILAFLYLTHTEKQRERLTQAIIALPTIDVESKDNQSNQATSIADQNVSIYGHIEKLHSYILLMQQEHNERLLLQRDLLHGVAHEFRSPMARIQFALDMLEDLPKSSSEEEQDKLCHSMHTSLSDLDKLVKELLYYARLKDSESALNYQLISIPEVCKLAIEQVATFYPKVTFEFYDNRLTDDSIQADENLIKRMVINLLRNAGRFASSTCRIQLDSLLINSNRQLILLVEDDGIGIAPGKAERIFEPFTRLDPSRSRDSGGCGLGLAIVSSIIQKHHGEVLLIDGKLSGACFQITLPMKQH